MTYEAELRAGRWVVVRRADLRVVSRQPMSHEDAVVLAERLNAEVPDGHAYH